MTDKATENSEPGQPATVAPSAQLGLVERLRQGTGDGQKALMIEAADEIASLCEEAAVLRTACERWEQALKRSDEARREAIAAEREQCAIRAAIHSYYRQKNRDSLCRRGCCET